MSVNAILQRHAKTYFHFSGDQPCLKKQFKKINLENNFLVNSSLICKSTTWQNDSWYSYSSLKMVVWNGFIAPGKLVNFFLNDP